MAHKRIGEILKEMDLVTDAEVKEALKTQKEKGGLLGEILVALGYITEKDLLFAIGAQNGMEVVDLDELEVPTEALSKVPVNYCEDFGICPVSFDGKLLVVALADPLNVNLLDELRFICGCEVQGAVSNKDAVDRAVKKYYEGQTGESLDDIMKQLAAEADAMQIEEGGGFSVEDLEKAANSTPVVKLLNLVLLQAIKDHAADVHIEPFERELKIRYRIDGVLYEMMPPPHHLGAALTSRVKVMSKLDISETRLPQDGRIELNIGGRPVDLRVSTLPTMFGESVVMRILDRSNISLDIEKIGFRLKELDLLKQLIAKPNGIMLVTGPTGSGKTTTLYAALKELNTPDMNIQTAEDPVEYMLSGVNQMQMKQSIGLTFARALKCYLRQDPDIILVGEIRDLETAEIAIEAALTGHQLLSTLHTNDAAGTVTRFVDMGVEPFLVASSLLCVCAQRLMRRVCQHCKEKREATKEEKEFLKVDLDAAFEMVAAKMGGCTRCNGMGYKGRTGVHELMVMNDELREVCTRHGVSGADIDKVAKKHGMISLFDDAMEKVKQGLTTFEEALRTVRVEKL